MRKLYTIAWYTACSQGLHRPTMRQSSGKSHTIFTTVFSKIRKGKSNHIISVKKCMLKLLDKKSNPRKECFISLS